MAQYPFSNYGKHILFVGSSYVCLYESNPIVSDMAHQAGGELLEEIYVPLDVGLQDFSKAIGRIGRPSRT